MGMVLMRFCFAGEPPALRDVFDGVRGATDVPVRFVDRGKGTASLLVPKKWDCVGLVRKGTTIELHCALAAGLLPATVEALRHAGGQHPPSQADPDNPDYGEAWMGVLAEGDDCIVDPGDRAFRIWERYLEALYPNSAGSPLDGLEDSLWNGRPLSLDLGALVIAIENTIKQPVDDQVWSPAETEEVFGALLDFLRAAASRGRSQVTIRTG